MPFLYIFYCGLFLSFFFLSLGSARGGLVTTHGTDFHTHSWAATCSLEKVTYRKGVLRLSLRARLPAEMIRVKPKVSPGFKGYFEF